MADMEKTGKNLEGRGFRVHRFASGTDDTSPCFAEDSIAQFGKSNKRLHQIFRRDIVEAVNFQISRAMLQCSLFEEGRA